MCAPRRPRSERREPWLACGAQRAACCLAPVRRARPLGRARASSGLRRACARFSGAAAACPFRPLNCFVWTSTRSRARHTDDAGGRERRADKGARYQGALSAPSPLFAASRWTGAGSVSPGVRAAWLLAAQPDPLPVMTAASALPVLAQPSCPHPRVAPGGGRQRRCLRAPL